MSEHDAEPNTTNTVDLDAIANIARVGINRAYIFMGFAVNSARDPNLQDFEVPDGSIYSLVFDDLNDDTRSKLKAEYASWAISNALRDMIEYFDVYLDKVYGLLLEVEDWKARKDGTDAGLVKMRDRRRKFRFAGTSKKLDYMRSEFGIQVEFSEDLETIKKARNCLTHRIGIVGEEDLNHGGALKATWRVTELYGFSLDGSEFIPPQNKFPMIMPSGSPVMMRQKQKSKRTGLGERVAFETTEVKEICFTLLHSINSTQAAVANYAEQQGVIVNRHDRKANSHPPPPSSDHESPQ